MSNSKLVSYTKISPNKTSNRTHVIDTISIHCMAGNLTIEACGNLFASSSRQASSNYGIGSDGRIGMYVEEKDRSWCTSSADNDNRAVTIEVANIETTEPFTVSDAAMKSLIRLCTDICARNGINKLLWRADKSLIGQVNRQNMTVHRWFKNKSCPGNYLYNKHSYIATEVNKALGTYNASDYVVNTSTDLYTYGYIDPQSLIHVDAINPYIAVIGSKYTNINQTQLKNNDVVGALLYAGSHFTQGDHTVKKNAVNQYLKEQVQKLGDMPYGLYWPVYARSTQEAREECNALYYIISKYPPKLGLWLQISTGKSKATTDLIIKKYYQEMVKWGLKDKCGFYATKSDMSKFTWSKFQDTFYLWLIESSSPSAYDGKLLNPEFFTYTE